MNKRVDVFELLVPVGRPSQGVVISCWLGRPEKAVLHAFATILCPTLRFTSPSCHSSSPHLPPEVRGAKGIHQRQRLDRTRVGRSVT